MKYYAVVACGGKGIRFGGEPKQYKVMVDRPMFMHVLTTLDMLENVETIYLAVETEYMEYVGKLIEDYSIKTNVELVEAGETCVESEKNALKMILDVMTDEDKVLVVNADSPIAPKGLYNVVMAKITSESVVCPCIMPYERMYRKTSEGILEKLEMDNDELFEMQTPIGLDAATVKKLTESNEESPSLIEECIKLGIKVTATDGVRRNVKVTYYEDWQMAVAWKFFEDYAEKYLDGKELFG